ncbi:MAG: hypothetical protein J5993_03305 [Clostridia bacterium]|nr:hypothetical protein [Clostridia bacterium]
MFNLLKNTKKYAELFATLIEKGLTYFDVMIAGLIFAAFCYLVIYVFEAIGLYTIAKRENHAHKWFAFVPFLNSVLLGELGGDAYLFSAKIKRGGLWLAISSFVGMLGTAFFSACRYLVLANSQYENDKIIVPDAYAWAYNAVQFETYFFMIVDIVYSIFLAVVLVAFFRKYYPRNYMIMVFTSFFFPIVKGIMVFVVRKNKATDYQAYLRAQREAYMRRYQQQYDRNPYDPYNRPDNTPYRQNGSQNPTNPIDPFEEFPDQKTGNDQSPPDQGDNPFFN